jgi:glycosyltransferase involved in cell wall biosynthesis
MKITVAICTWNRAVMLESTLAAMRHLRIPDEVEWELLVVNNNCTDNTDGVISQYCRSLPLRRIFESRQGQCHARNVAIREATGELLLWTDDDVLVDEAWLQEYYVAATLFPDAAFMGGTIDPWFESPPPCWIQRNLKTLQGPLVIRQLGSDNRILRDDELPFGANMAFRTSILRQFPFDTSVGHVGHQLRGGDETDVFERMCASGLHGVWVGTAKVRHFIPSSRMNVAFLAKWCRDHGSGQAVRWTGEGCAKLFGMPRWAVVKYVRNSFKAFVLSPLRGPGWVSAFMTKERLGSFLRDIRRPRMRAKQDLRAAP